MIYKQKIKATSGDTLPIDGVINRLARWVHSSKQWWFFHGVAQATIERSKSDNLDTISTHTHSFKRSQLRHSYSNMIIYACIHKRNHRHAECYKYNNNNIHTAALDYFSNNNCCPQVSEILSLTSKSIPNRDKVTCMQRCVPFKHHHHEMRMPSKRVSWK